MPTRKEILEALGESIDDLDEEIQVFRKDSAEFTDAVENVARDFGITAEQVMEALDSNSLRNEVSANRIEKAVSGVGDSVFAGLMGAGLIFAIGKGMHSLFKMIDEDARAFENRLSAMKEKSEFIYQVIHLQNTFGAIGYDFITKRAFLKGRNRAYKEELLTELLHEGIAVSSTPGDLESISIDTTGGALRDHWRRLETANEEYQEMKERLRRAAERLEKSVSKKAT